MDDAGTLGLGHIGLGCELLVYSVKIGVAGDCKMFLVVYQCISRSL